MSLSMHIAEKLNALHDLERIMQNAEYNDAHSIGDQMTKVKRQILKALGLFNFDKDFHEEMSALLISMQNAEMSKDTDLQNDMLCKIKRLEGDFCEKVKDLLKNLQTLYHQSDDAIFKLEISQWSRDICQRVGCVCKVDLEPWKNQLTSNRKFFEKVEDQWRHKNPKTKNQIVPMSVFKEKKEDSAFSDYHSLMCELFDWKEIALDPGSYDFGRNQYTTYDFRPIKEANVSAKQQERDIDAANGVTTTVECMADMTAQRTNDFPIEVAKVSAKQQERNIDTANGVTTTVECMEDMTAQKIDLLTKSCVLLPSDCIPVTTSKRRGGQAGSKERSRVSGNEPQGSKQPQNEAVEAAALQEEQHKFDEKHHIHEIKMQGFVKQNKDRLRDMKDHEQTPQLFVFKGRSDKTNKNDKPRKSRKRTRNISSNNEDVTPSKVSKSKTSRSGQRKTSRSGGRKTSRSVRKKSSRIIVSDSEPDLNEEPEPEPDKKRVCLFSVSDRDIGRVESKLRYAQGRVQQLHVNCTDQNFHTVAQFVYYAAESWDICMQESPCPFAEARHILLQMRAELDETLPKLRQRKFAARQENVIEQLKKGIQMLWAARFA